MFCLPHSPPTPPQLISFPFFIFQFYFPYTKSTYISYQVPDPVAMFPLNSAYGTKDVKNSASPGIPNGVYLSTGPQGQIGGSYEFTGNAKSYIEFTNTAGGPLDVRYSMTLLCWVHCEVQNGPIFNYRTGGMYGVHLWVVNGKLFARFNRRDYVATNNLEHTSIVGRWTFVGASYDHTSGQINAWVDGILVQTKNIGGGIDLGTQDSVRMGVRDNDDRYFKGKISQMQVYDVALTQTQIQAIMNHFVGKNSCIVVFFY